MLGAPEAWWELMGNSQAKVLHTWRINPGFWRSSRKLIFCVFRSHPEGFVRVKTGPVSQLSVPCAARSSAEQACPRGREAPPAPPTTPYPRKGCRARPTRLPSMASCCLSGACLLGLLPQM